MEARKTSKKRQAILDALLETHTHPSAEQLYQRLKPRYPDLSLGTVYRNLSLFADRGDVLRLGPVHGQDRFDGRTDPNAHLLCTRCGQILDVELPPEAETLSAAVARATGAAVSSYSLFFRGLCAECRQKADEPSASA